MATIIEISEKHSIQRNRRSNFFFFFPEVYCFWVMRSRSWDRNHNRSWHGKRDVFLINTGVNDVAYLFFFKQGEDTLDKNTYYMSLCFTNTADSNLFRENTLILFLSNTWSSNITLHHHYTNILLFQLFCFSKFPII